MRDYNTFTEIMSYILSTVHTDLGNVGQQMLLIINVSISVDLLVMLENCSWETGFFFFFALENLVQYISNDGIGVDGALDI